VLITNETGCMAQSSIDAIFIGIEELNESFATNIYPNPSHGIFTIEILSGSSAEEISVAIENTLSQKIISFQEKISSNDWKKKIDLSAEPRGTYFIEIKTNDYFVRKKVVFD